VLVHLLQVVGSVRRFFGLRRCQSPHNVPQVIAVVDLPVLIAFTREFGGQGGDDIVGKLSVFFLFIRFYLVL
jgi:hypothetical protein